MSAITKERIELFIKNPLDNGLTRGEQMELARIALASLEADVVAWEHEWASCITCDGPQNFERIIEHEAPPEWATKSGQARNLIPLYTAPPAPVSIPDEMTTKQASRSYCGEVRGYRDGWNDCRAAMLQGADDSLSHDGKNNPEDKLGMVDHFGGSNNMVEPVTDNTNQQFESLSRDDK